LLSCRYESTQLRVRKATSQSRLSRAMTNSAHELKNRR
jgi:hypothetical protein